MDKRQLVEYGFSKEMERHCKIWDMKLSQKYKIGVPLVLIGKDIIVKSQTGSGKTAAFAIPYVKR